MMAKAGHYRLLWSIGPTRRSQVLTSSVAWAASSPCTANPSPIVAAGARVAYSSATRPMPLTA